MLAMKREFSVSSGFPDDVTVNSGLMTAASSNSTCVDSENMAFMSPLTELSDFDKDTMKELEDPSLSPVALCDDVLKEGGEILTRIEEILCRVAAGGLPRSVWDEDLENLRELVLPRAYIAFSGATGSGKSSLLNAILGDSIVATSGMEACTAVMTQISYKEEKGISAGVEFLAREEWEAEIKLLLEDLQTDKRSIGGSDGSNPAVIAWRKIQAVYPTLKLEALEKMSVDDVINQSEEVKRVLGSSEQLKAQNSKEFQPMCAPYMQSTQSRNGGAALWPLVRCLKIYCNAPALSTGAVLVDLPGGGDTNAARCAVAERELKKCKHVWVIVPVTRAGDDQQAKNLIDSSLRNKLINGCLEGESTNAITIVATKCDDVVATEFESVMDDAQRGEYNRLRDELAELRAQRASLKVHEDAETQERLHLAKQSMVAGLNDLLSKHKPDENPSGALKRPLEVDPDAPPKRRRTIASTTEAEGHHSSLQILGADITAFGMHLQNIIACNSNTKTQIFHVEQRIDSIQHQINTLCAFIRSEAITRRMKETAKAEFLKVKGGIDEEDFDPDAEDDGYAVDAINDKCLRDLPVFASSSRDYSKIRKICGYTDDPVTFTTEEETQIPALQRHCHSLAASARFHAAQEFVNRLNDMVESLAKHLSRKDLSQATENDKLELRKRWGRHSVKGKDAEGSHQEGKLSSPRGVKPSSGQKETGLVAELSRALKVAALEFADNLKSHFRNRIGDRVKHAAIVAAGTAPGTVRNLVEQKKKPKEKDTMPWTTLRAMLRRKGKWKDIDLNARLVDEMLSLIAKDWRTLFAMKFFEEQAPKFIEVVEKHLDAVVASAPPSLIENANEAATLARGMVRDNIMTAMVSSRGFADGEQQLIHKEFSNMIKVRLKPVYRDVLNINGKGSIAKQRVKLPAEIQRCAGDIYQEGAEQIMLRMDYIAVETGKHLQTKLKRICKKVDGSMSKLWSSSEDGGEQPKAFTKALGEIQMISSQIPSLAERCKDHSKISLF